MVDSVKHFAPYLLGADFVVVTDHSALTFLTTMKNGGPRLTRWALALQPFPLTVVHHPGAANLNADDLLRQDTTDSPEGLDANNRLFSLEGGKVMGPCPQSTLTHQR